MCRRWIGFCAVLCVTAVTWTSPATAKGPAAHKPAAASQSDAEQLVHAALRSETNGDDEERQQRLAEALSRAPDYPAAHWHSGQVRYEGKWLSPSAMQQLIAGNALLTDYRKQCKFGDDTPDGHAEIARWCAKHKLHDEEQIQWRLVLALEPGHQEAARRLGLVWYEQAWRTPEEVKTHKQQIRQYKAQLAHWTPTIERWQLELQRGDATSRAEADDKLRAIDDSEAMPALANCLSSIGHSRKLEAPDVTSNLALVAALGNMPDQMATNLLIRESLLNPSESVALAAADALRPRNLQSYVPILLSLLATPVESKFSVQPSSDGTIAYRHSFLYEGQRDDSSFVQETLIRPTCPLNISGDIRVAQANAQAAVARTYARAETLQKQVAAANAASEARNRRIQFVLSRTTGNQLGNEPSAWWREWLNYNELYEPTERDYHEQSSRTFETYFVPPPAQLVALSATSTGSPVTTPSKEPTLPWYYYTLHSPIPPPFLAAGVFKIAQLGKSCFAAGTLVETLAGPMAIEKIKPGDRVLSQHPETGELAYRSVITTTVRPPAAMLRVRVSSPRSKIGADADTITATKGHPFWVAGHGWQMTKQLEPGVRLHTPIGSAEVEALAEEEPAEAYNLVVDGFHTYFVGRQQVLAHDNSFATPLLNPLPGLPSEE